MLYKAPNKAQSYGMTRNEKSAIDHTGAGIGEAGARAAVNGAQRYLAAHNLIADSAKLADAISRHCKANIQTALDDAREAFDCGMTEIGAATFAATMMQAGIAAAKEATGDVK